jgi:hypothetical protein
MQSNISYIFIVKIRYLCEILENRGSWKFQNYKERFCTFWRLLFVSNSFLHEQDLLLFSAFLKWLADNTYSE